MKNQIEQIFAYNIPIKKIEINIKNYKKSSISLYEEIAYDFFSKKGFNVIATTYYNRNKKDSYGLKYHLPNLKFNKNNFEKWLNWQKTEKRLKEIIYQFYLRKEWNYFLNKSYFIDLSLPFKERIVPNGKPDLFIYNNKDFYFVEIKSEYDTLSLEQLNWINEANKIGLKTFVLFIKNSTMF